MKREDSEEIFCEVPPSHNRKAKPKTITEKNEEFDERRLKEQVFSSRNQVSSYTDLGISILDDSTLNKNHVKLFKYNQGKEFIENLK